MFCKLWMLDMVCISNYSQAKELIQPKRVSTLQELTIGTLAASTSYKVYAYREELDKIKVITASTDNTGVLTVDLTAFPVGFFRAFNVYYFWVTLPSVNITEREDITVGSFQTPCIKVEFVRVQDYDNVNNVDLDVLTASQTIDLV